MTREMRPRALDRDPLTGPDGIVRPRGGDGLHNKVLGLELEALLPIMLALSGFVGVTPLVVIRALEGSYVVAVVDAIAALSFLVVAWVIYRYNAVRVASVYLAIVATAAMVAVIHLRGSGMIFWAYPTVIGLFFLLRPLEAFVMATVAIGAALPVLLAEQDSILTTVVILSFVITLGDAAAFAALTVAQRRRLQATARIDSLTGVANRRAMDETMPDIMARSRDSGQPVSLIMLDIDHFKGINDEYGHSVGDRVLISVARCIRDNVRPADRVFRVGGEEFVVIAEDAGLSLAQRLGETLREAVAEKKILSRVDPHKSVTVTISLGISELLTNESADHWYKRADGALYDAKRSGRNRAFLADKTVSLSGTSTFSVRTRALELS